MNLEKYFIEGFKITDLYDLTCLYELTTDKGIYYLSISSDTSGASLVIYDESLENEIKNYYSSSEPEEDDDEDEEYTQGDCLEDAFYTFDAELDELFKIIEISEVNNEEIFEKWSEKWM